MSTAKDRLDAAIRDVIAETHPDDLVTDWVVAVHRVGREDMKRKVIGRIISDGQPLHGPRGLLDVALEAERREIKSQ
jgi:hypothetical protein